MQGDPWGRVVDAVTQLRPGHTLAVELWPVRTAQHTHTHTHTRYVMQSTHRLEVGRSVPPNGLHVRLPL